MKNRTINPTAVAVTLGTILLIFFMLFHSFGMLSGDEDRLLGYLNIYTREPLKVLTATSGIVLKITGFLAMITSILLVIALFKQEPLRLKNASILKWALFAAISCIAVYGGLVRSVSNQQGAANLFFLTVLLYLLLGLLEKKTSGSSPVYSSMALLPFYFVLFYTMGLPGWAKIFGGPEVTTRYATLFKDSFIASLPGGTSLMIIILGILELLIPVLLIISLLKGEWRQKASKRWLNHALLVTILTFTMLCFGLTVLLNFAGSANLVFYAIFTFLMFIYVNNSSHQSHPPAL